MQWVALILLGTVLVRLLSPLDGFLLDDDTESVVALGMREQIHLRNISAEQREAFIVHDMPQVQKPAPVPVKDDYEDVGVDMSEIQTKKSKQPEINTDYLYSNIDGSDESLSEVMSKAFNGRE